VPWNLATPNRCRWAASRDEAAFRSKPPPGACPAGLLIPTLASAHTILSEQRQERLFPLGTLEELQKNFVVSICG